METDVEMCVHDCADPALGEYVVVLVKNCTYHNADSLGLAHVDGRFTFIFADRSPEKMPDQVIPHEVGHLLGWNHVDDPENVMSRDGGPRLRKWQ